MTTDATPVNASGSSNGQPILIVAGSTPGTVLHAATSAATEWDEVEVYVSNTDTTDRKFTLEVGGATAGKIIEQTIPAEGGAVFVWRGRVQGGTSIAGFAATANVLNATVIVNRLAVS